MEKGRNGSLRNCSVTQHFVKPGPDFHFEISEIEIMRVDYIYFNTLSAENFTKSAKY